MAFYSMLAFKVNAVGVDLPTDSPEKALLQKQSFSLLGRCLLTKQGAGQFFLQPVDAEPGHQLYDVAEPKWVTASKMRSSSVATRTRSMRVAWVARW